jgi:acyl-CoA synthetase (AMP-forming)/AMP-acid ligase II
MLVNLAVLQELIAGALAEREAIVWDDRAYTYAAFAARCRRVARALRALGLGCRTERAHLQPWESGHDHVALYLHNGPEYLEAMYGAYKARASAVNVNYRYVADELHYVLANSDARAIIYHATFAPVLAAVRGRLPALRHFIQVADDSGEPLLDGAVAYAAWVAAQPDDPLDLPYSPDDLYILYTGGTTGLPKGVLWRHEDVYYNGLGGHIPGFPRIETEAQLLEHVQLGLGGRSLVCLPFIHGAGQWNAVNTFHRGGTVVLPDERRRLDPHAVWRAVERHRVDQLMVIGDAFARPLLAALREGARGGGDGRAGRPYDVSSIRLIVSTAAVLSPAVRDELLGLLPAGTMVLESIGGSELGLQAMSFDTASRHHGLPAYELRAGTVLLRTDRSGLLDRARARPGPQGDLGWFASTGHLPLGYLGDPEKTRQTFPVIGGVRYVVAGDQGCYDESGRVLFLGREAACINTGGEKVFAEEVERVVKSHPAVYDALVVGVPSERWGQQVTAVVSLTPGSTAPALETLRAHCARHLADYKVPKALVTAAEIVRSPSGKPDYAWAREYAATRSRSPAAPEVPRAS